jgi:hypothetical protein
LLVADFRPSNIDASRHARAILKLRVGRLREAWPEVKITVRAASGFGRWRLSTWPRFSFTAVRPYNGV